MAPLSLSEVRAVAGITAVTRSCFSRAVVVIKKNATAVKVRSRTGYVRSRTIADKHIVINGAMRLIAVKFIIL